MNLRHWLIKKLALGDMIILNTDFVFGGVRSQNCGPGLIDNVFVRDWESDYGIGIGNVYNCAIKLDDPHDLCISNLYVDLTIPNVPEVSTDG